MTDIPDQFALPQDAFERQRSLLTAHLKTQVQTPRSPRQARRRRLVALAAAVLVVVVGTASAIGGVRALILDRGFIGLPPEGATPSAPERGDLVVHWVGRSGTHARGRYAAPLVRAWVYADGRMIWSEESSQSSRSVPEGANEFTSGYLEQRLSPDGVEFLRSGVAELFDRSRALVQTVPDDASPGLPGGPVLIVPPFQGFFWGVLEVPSGDRLVSLRWGDLETGEHFGGTKATPEQLSALRRVDALLTDPASVLPASAWAVREVRAYVPTHYAVCIDTSPPKDASQLLSLLPTRAADLLRDKSRTSSEADLLTNIDQVPGHMVVIGRSVTYCSKLTTEEAREVAEALSGLAQDQDFHGVVLAYRVAEAVNNLNPTSIWFEPYFPHGQVTCSACG